MRKICLLVTVLALVAGCATVNLDKGIAGESCTNRQSCIKALNLPNPTNPTYTFAIAPYPVKARFKNAVGMALPWFPPYKGNIDICLANAFKTQFPAARIMLSKDRPIDGNAIFVYGFKNFEIEQGWVYAAKKSSFSGSVRIGSRAYPIDAAGWSGFMVAGHIASAAEDACMDFAKKAKKLLLIETHEAKTAKN